MASICVFGDSIVWGAWDRELGGWVNRLQLSLEEKGSDVEVYNLGISADTSVDLLNRFGGEAAARITGAGDVAIISIGVNDSATDDEGNLFISAIPFKENLTNIVLQAKEAGLRVLLMGLEDIDESKTNPVSWANVYYSQEDLDKYSKIVEEVAAETESYFLSIKGLLKNEDLEDGLHPNAQGHAKIAETVENFLIENLPSQIFK